MLSKLRLLASAPVTVVLCLFRFIIFEMYKPTILLFELIGTVIASNSAKDVAIVKLDALIT